MGSEARVLRGAGPVRGSSYCEGVTVDSCRFVFFLDPCNVDLVQRRIRSTALCVSLCPPEELKSYQDLKRFAAVNGEVWGGGVRRVRAMRVRVLKMSSSPRLGALLLRAPGPEVPRPP